MASREPMRAPKGMLDVLPPESARWMELVARFAELATRLTAPDAPFAAARVAVLAAAHERAQAAPLLAALPAARVIDLVGKTDLLTAAAVFSAETRASSSLAPVAPLLRCRPAMVAWSRRPPEVARPGCRRGIGTWSRGES